MDEEQLKKWISENILLFDQATASRIAVRVSVNLPWNNWDKAEWSQDITFSSLRCILISSQGFDKLRRTNLVLPAQDAFEFAEAVAKQAYATQKSSSLSRSAALVCRLSVQLISKKSVKLKLLRSANRIAESKYVKLLSESEWDQDFVEKNKPPNQLINQKLFNVEGSDWLADDFSTLYRVANKYPEYKWWVDWLFAMHDGTFRDWDLAYSIATEVPNETWEKGALAVAEKIQEFQEQVEDKGSNNETRKLSLAEHQARQEFAKVAAEALASAPTLSRIRARSQAVKILSFCQTKGNQIVPEDDEYPSLLALQALGISFESIADLLAEIERLRTDNKSISDKNDELVEKIEGHLDKISDLQSALAKLRSKKFVGAGIIGTTVGLAVSAGAWIASEAIEIGTFIHITPINGPVEVSIPVPEEIRALEEELCMWEGAIISCELLEKEEKTKSLPAPPSRPSTE